jgi:hypothetical protein
MAKPTPQQCHALTSHYIKLFKQKFGTEPVVNRHSARWGFDSVLLGMPPSEAKELLEFYFTTGSTNRHDLQWFFYNYEKLEDSLTEVEKDQKARAKLRQESAQRAKEWRERGNTGIANS